MRTQSLPFDDIFDDKFSFVTLPGAFSIHDDGWEKLLLKIMAGEANL